MSEPLFPEFTTPAPKRYPEVPGARRRDTSIAAAKSVEPTVTDRRAAVLAVITAKPSTADEVARALGWTVLSARPRATELAKLGKIEDSGQRRKTDSGSNAIVWRAVR